MLAARSQRQLPGSDGLTGRDSSFPPPAPLPPWVLPAARRQRRADCTAGAVAAPPPPQLLALRPNLPAPPPCTFHSRIHSAIATTLGSARAASRPPAMVPPVKRDNADGFTWWRTAVATGASRALWD